MKLSLGAASPADAAEITVLRNEAARELSARYGKGHWGYQASEISVVNGMTGKSKVLVAKYENEIAGTLRLQTKKPWAIDPAYFTKVAQPLYLIDMTVHPALQGKGIGRFMLQEVVSFVRAWPAQAIRLDAYDSAAGAGDFYRKCGYSERGRVVYRGQPLIYFELLIHLKN